MPESSTLRNNVTIEVILLPGRKPQKIGRQHLILIALELTNPLQHDIQLANPKNQDPKTIAECVRTMVDPGSHLTTGAWPGFEQLEQSGYKHKIVRSSRNPGEYVSEKGETIAADLERWIMQTHRGAIRDLKPYLREFAFRYNQHLRPTQLFNAVLELAATGAHEGD